LQIGDGRLILRSVRFACNQIDEEPFSSTAGAA
jgi:hypothetical protein